MQQQSNSHRYLSIGLSLAVFIGAITTILTLNFTLAKELQQDTQALTIISRQQAQLESIIKYAYNINRLAHLEANYSIDVDLLHAAFRDFDETLESMIYGASSIGRDQSVNQLLTDKQFLRTHQDALENINKSWQQYRSKISPLANAYFSGDDRVQIIEKSNAAIQAGDSFHLALSSGMLTLNGITEQQTHSKLQRIRTIQYAGLAISALSLLTILGLFFSKVRKSDNALANKEAENREILSAVSDGLFLVDREGVIGEQVSDSLQTILAPQPFAGQKLNSILQKYVSPETLKTTEDYIDLLFSEHVEESLVQTLNPLSETLFIIEHEGKRAEKYLDFSFKRTWSGEAISHVLVSLRDVTANIALKKQLQNTKQQNSQQHTVLLALLRQAPQDLLDCISNAQSVLEGINKQLQFADRQSNNLEELALQFMQTTHALKGEFATLQLDELLQQCQQLEMLFSEIAALETVDGQNFIAAALQIEQLDGNLNLYQDLILELNNYRQPQQGNINAQQNWQSNTEQYLCKMANSQEKQLAVQWDIDNLLQLPSEMTRDIKTIITQTLRNAVHHGIEPSAERKRLKKSSSGNISVQVEQSAQTLRVTVADDGCGINLAAVKDKLQQLGRTDADSYSERQLLATLFESQISTSDSKTADAGQGAGLALVASLLGKYRGKVQVRRDSRGWTAFHYSLPLPSRKAGTQLTARELFGDELNTSYGVSA